MKRRATVVAVAVAALAVGGVSTASAASLLGGPARQDTSGCLVLFPDAPNPLTICLFPR